MECNKQDLEEVIHSINDMGMLTINHIFYLLDYFEYDYTITKINNECIISCDGKFFKGERLVNALLRLSAEIFRL